MSDQKILKLSFFFFLALTQCFEFYNSLTQQLFIGGTNINNDVEKFKNEGGNIIIGTPGRIEDLLMGKTDISHKNLFVQAMKSLVSILFAKTKVKFK